MASDDPEPDALTPAASLILMRDRRSAPPELLIVRRSKSLRFAGGAYVFPGGRIDPADALLAARHCAQLDPGDGAARIAAARETIEETAVVAGLRPTPDRAAALTVLLADGHIFDGDAFTPFARWQPHAGVPRRFDTRFYLAEAPSGVNPVADGTETADAFWASAADVLIRCAAGDGFVIFPTRRLLERLARFDSLMDARDEALRLPQRIITPVVRDGLISIPGDAGYPVVSESWEAVRGE